MTNIPKANPVRSTILPDNRYLITKDNNEFWNQMYILKDILKKQPIPEIEGILDHHFTISGPDSWYPLELDAILNKVEPKKASEILSALINSPVEGKGTFFKNARYGTRIKLLIKQLEVNLKIYLADPSNTNSDKLTESFQALSPNIDNSKMIDTRCDFVYEKDIDKHNTIARNQNLRPFSNWLVSILSKVPKTFIAKNPTIIDSPYSERACIANSPSSISTRPKTLSDDPS